MRQRRIEVFRDTMDIVRRGCYIVGGKPINIENDFTIYDRTKCYHQEFVTNAPMLGTPTEVEVANEDCLVAARKLLDEGLHPAVLNLASRQNPGGGVVNGSGAQEENLFRRTNLFLSMFPLGRYSSVYGFPKSRLAYPLDRNWGGVYTKAATVFKGTEKDDYSLLEEPFLMDFIAVPAINRPDLDATGMLTPPMAEATKRKMRTIFRIGLENGNDSLVLGAMGCGAFHNPPVHIARLFHEVMQEPEFLDRYKKIVFAIIEDHNSRNGDGNYLPFKWEFIQAKDIKFNKNRNFVQLNDGYISAEIRESKRGKGKWRVYGFTRFVQMGCTICNEDILHRDYDEMIAYSSWEGIAFVAFRDGTKWGMLKVTCPISSSSPEKEKYEIVCQPKVTSIDKLLNEFDIKERVHYKKWVLRIRLHGIAGIFIPSQPLTWVDAKSRL